MLKSSKIDGRFTKLKAKTFSFNTEVVPIAEETQLVEEPVQKDFSVATVKERVRIGKCPLAKDFVYLFWNISKQ